MTVNETGVPTLTTIGLLVLEISMLDNVTTTASVVLSRDASVGVATSGRPSVTGTSMAPSLGTSGPPASARLPSADATSRPISSPPASARTSAAASATLTSEIPTSIVASETPTSGLVSGVPPSCLVSDPRPASKRPSARPSPASPPSPFATRSPLRPPQAPNAPINAKQSTSLVLVIASAAPASVRAVSDAARLHSRLCMPLTRM